MASKKIITITKAASLKLSDILKKNNANALRFYVKGGGCNGFNYKLEPNNNPPDKIDEVIINKDVKLKKKSINIHQPIKIES